MVIMLLKVGLHWKYGTVAEKVAIFTEKCRPNRFYQAGISDILMHLIQVSIGYGEPRTC